MLKTRQLLFQSMTTRAVLCAFWTFSLLFAGCSGAAESPEVKLERARILMQRGRPAEAVPVLNEAGASDTENDEVYYQRGVAHEQLDLLEKALEDYSLCLKYAPDRSDALNNKAVVLAKMERYEEAADEFRKLVESSPEDPLAYRNRALCFADLKRYDDALADYAKAIELAPADPAGWFQRGNVYLTQKRHEEAIADYTRAIELDGQLSMAFMNRGVAHYRLRQFDAAKKDLEHAQGMDDSIVIPGVDFFGTEVQAATPSASPDAWLSYRTAAEKILIERGFRDVRFTSEFPLLRCAICTASDKSGARRIVVCGRHPDGSIMFPESAETSATSTSIESLLILRPDESSTIVAEKFIDDCSGTPMEPASRFTQYK